MEDLLDKIRKENDRIYSHMPLKYRISVNDLGEAQNKLLLSFLRYESVSANCDSDKTSPINGSGSSVRLFEVLKKRRDAMGGMGETFEKLAYSPKFLSSFDNIPQSASLDLRYLFDCDEKLVDLDETFYESVFAYLSDESVVRSNFDLEMINSFDFRKGVYQRIFPEKEQFVWYKGVGLDLNQRIAESVKYFIEAINERNKKRGLLGSFVGGSAKKFFGNIVSDKDDSEVVEKKYAYIKNTADKLYGAS